MQYKKILLKLSGEALAKDSSTIISKDKIDHFVSEIKSVTSLGVSIGIVIGGGNIMRGEQTNSLKLTRYKSDNIGMLATMVNAIALEDTLNRSGVNSVLLSAIEMPKVCDFYRVDIACKALEEGKVVVFGGGIANPYFSTDTCTILRALEVGAEIVFKGTQVDGVFNDDPRKNPLAKRYSSVSYDQVIDDKLKVMDLSAILLAQKNKLPIVVFDIHKAGNFKNVVLDRYAQSIITN